MLLETQVYVNDLTSRTTGALIQLFWSRMLWICFADESRLWQQGRCCNAMKWLCVHTGGIVVLHGSTLCKESSFECWTTTYSVCLLSVSQVNETRSSPWIISHPCTQACKKAVVVCAVVIVEVCSSYVFWGRNGHMGVWHLKSRFLPWLRPIFVHNTQKLRHISTLLANMSET